MPEPFPERLRESFDAIAEAYAGARPAPPREAFDAICDLAPPPARLLEIGCGPGNATVRLAERGYRIHAIEIGASLAELARARLAGFPFTVEVGAFEDAVLEPGSVDVVGSSSAFHWLDTERALAQVARVLRPGGAVALLWTSAGRELEDPALGPALDAVYREHAPELAVDAAGLARSAIDGVGAALAGDPMFEGCVERRFVQPLHFAAEAFVALLGTYSDHAVLPAPVRAGLFGAVRRLIEERFGGAVVRNAETRMFCARRTMSTFSRAGRV